MSRSLLPRPGWVLWGGRGAAVHLPAALGACMRHPKPYSPCSVSRAPWGSLPCGEAPEPVVWAEPAPQPASPCLVARRLFPTTPLCILNLYCRTNVKMCVCRCRAPCRLGACTRAEISQVVHLLLQLPCSCQPIGAVCCGCLVGKRFFGAGLGLVLVLLRCIQPRADPAAAEVCRQSAALWGFG